MIRPSTVAGLVMLFMALACASGISPTGTQTTVASERAKERSARHALETARALRNEGRSDAALRTVERVLRDAPSDHATRAELHALAAELANETGDPQLAAYHTRHARDLDPPPGSRRPAPPEPATAPRGAVAWKDRARPDTPALAPLELPLDATGVAIVLLPPELDRTRPAHLQRATPLSDWPRGFSVSELEAELTALFPGVSLEIGGSDRHPTARDVAVARRWVRERATRAVATLRVDRHYCDSSEREGRFSVVWTRVASTTSVESLLGPEKNRFVRHGAQAPPARKRCLRIALQLALRDLLGHAPLHDALTAPAADAWPLSSQALRTLFPDLDRRVRSHVERGRELVRTGRIEEARDEFARAVAVDPDDLDAKVFLAEAETSLAIANQLDQGRRGAKAERVSLELSAAEREDIARQIEAEKSARHDLEAALAVMSGEPNLPPALDSTRLHPAPLGDPNRLALRLARARSDVPVEARKLYEPSGEVVAHYLVRSDDGQILIREHDDERGTLTGYDAGVRSDVWEDPEARGVFSRHVRYAGDGETIERVEVSTNYDERVDRVLVYEAGRLVRELRDTNDDGRFDTTDDFDDSGELVQRSEDRNGDGEVDVRSHYADGRLARREILDPDLARGMRRGGS